MSISAGLNISTGHQTISGKKSSYIEQKLVNNAVVWHEVKKIIEVTEVLKLGKHSVSIGLNRKIFLIKRILINFIKKETLAQMFSCEFCEISKNTFFTEHLWTATSYP